MPTTRTLIVTVMCLMFAMTLQAASFSKAQDAPQRNAAHMASPYVPLESWVYSAFERLASDGYLQSAFFDLRPWTRMDCARLVEEVEDQTAYVSVNDETVALLRSLKEEFAPELQRRQAGATWSFVWSPWTNGSRQLPADL